MPSLISEYNYDIFISYRQKDNKGERWVSEFVDALKTELESIFKEEISVFFDINPHDGLLETHDVDSLGIIGRNNEAREILDELLSRQKQVYVSKFWIATVHLGLCEINQALDLLQEGYEKRDSFMHMINAYVQFDLLRNEQRYQNLCRKMNLPL